MPNDPIKPARVADIRLPDRPMSLQEKTQFYLLKEHNTTIRFTRETNGDWTMEALECFGSSKLFLDALALMVADLEDHGHQIYNYGGSV